MPAVRLMRYDRPGGADSTVASEFCMAGPVVAGSPPPAETEEPDDGWWDVCRCRRIRRPHPGLPGPARPDSAQRVRRLAGPGRPAAGPDRALPGPSVRGAARGAP